MFSVGACRARTAGDRYSGVPAAVLLASAQRIGHRRTGAEPAYSGRPGLTRCYSRCLAAPPPHTARRRVAGRAGRVSPSRGLNLRATFGRCYAASGANASRRLRPCPTRATIRRPETIRGALGRSARVVSQSSAGRDRQRSATWREGTGMPRSSRCRCRCAIGRATHASVRRTLAVATTPAKCAGGGGASCYEKSL